MPSKDYYIGLMTGTSIDAIDAALVNFSSGQPQLTFSQNTRIPDELKRELHALTQPGDNEIERMGIADRTLGELLADSATNLLRSTGIRAEDIHAIGSHGQTIRHRPDLPTTFTLQIGDPNVIATRTGIVTIGDFRRHDMALGGEGAPLAPAFHNAVLRSNDEDRIILNIGGISNITVLPADPNADVVGFDTGPGNTLLDANAKRSLDEPYDKYGRLAAEGTANKDLLNALLRDSYFSAPPPKSTGREYFNWSWLESTISKFDISPADLQATLAQLTVESIMRAIKCYGTEQGKILVCGGGVRNTYLFEQLQNYRDQYEVVSTADYGIDPDVMEAMCFAWLAKQRLENKPGNLPSVTGADKAVVLGGIYQP